MKEIVSLQHNKFLVGREGGSELAYRTKIRKHKFLPTMHLPRTSSILAIEPTYTTVCYWT